MIIRATALLLTALFSVGCGSSVLVRSTPPDAKVFINNGLVGTTPVKFTTRDVRPLPYRVEKTGYPTAEGVLSTRVAPGRIVGAVFTAGIFLIFRPIRDFSPEVLDVTLGPTVPPTAAIHLYNVRTATVFDGECAPQNGTCWITLESGKRCQGEYVRENQGTTTVTATTKTVTGGAVGVAGGNLAGGTFGAQNSLVGSGREIANH